MKDLTCPDCGNRLSEGGGFTHVEPVNQLRSLQYDGSEVSLAEDYCTENSTESPHIFCHQCDEMFPVPFGLE